MYKSVIPHQLLLMKKGNEKSWTFWALSIRNFKSRSLLTHQEKYYFFIFFPKWPLAQSNGHTQNPENIHVLRLENVVVEILVYLLKKLVRYQFLPSFLFGWQLWIFCSLFFNFANGFYTSALRLVDVFKLKCSIPIQSELGLTEKSMTKLNGKGWAIETNRNIFAESMDVSSYGLDRRLASFSCFCVLDKKIGTFRKLKKTQTYKPNRHKNPPHTMKKNLKQNQTW